MADDYDFIVTFADFEVRPEDSDYYLAWEWIGEGVSGDYNPSDVYDEPQLRFTIYTQDDEQVDDASYCTGLSITTPQPLLELFAGILLDAVELPYYKKELQWLTWTTRADLLARHEKESDDG